MSKYIKLEDAINLFGRSGEYHADAIVDMLFFLPTIEVSEDCISREWVLNRLTKYQKDYALNELDDWQNTVVEWITTDIEDAPSVVPSRAEGEWIIDVPPSTSHGTIYTCPFCGHEEEFEPTNYCPACGEKMKG